jgi:hypothetical protein
VAILHSGVKLVLLTILVLLVFSVPSGSGSTHAQPMCTSAASSASLGEESVTTWYPVGCLHP